MRKAGRGKSLGHPLVAGAQRSVTILGEIIGLERSTTRSALRSAGSICGKARQDMSDQGLPPGTVDDERPAVRIGNRRIDGNHSQDRVVEPGERAERGGQSDIGPAWRLLEEAQVAPAKSEIGVARQIGRAHGGKQGAPIDQRIPARHHDIGMSEGGADIEDRPAFGLLRPAGSGKQRKTESGDEEKDGQESWQSEESGEEAK